MKVLNNLQSINKFTEIYSLYCNSRAYKDLDDSSLTLDDLARYTKNLRDEVKTIKQSQKELVSLIKQVIGTPGESPQKEQRLQTETAKTDVTPKQLAGEFGPASNEAIQIQSHRLETEEGLLGEGNNLASMRFFIGKTRF